MRGTGGPDKGIIRAASLCRCKLYAMWVYNPHVGGKPISPLVRASVTQRIQAYAAKHHAGKFSRIDLRFRGPLCYIDAYHEPDPARIYVPEGASRQERIEQLRNTPTHLCRLRYFGDPEHWSFAFYTYSQEKYEPSFFLGGSDHGTPEEAFETCAPFLQDV